MLSNCKDACYLMRKSAHTHVKGVEKVWTQRSSDKLHLPKPVCPGMPTHLSMLCFLWQRGFCSTEIWVRLSSNFVLLCISLSFFFFFGTRFLVPSVVRTAVCCFCFSRPLFFTCVGCLLDHPVLWHTLEESCSECCRVWTSQVSEGSMWTTVCLRMHCYTFTQ